jgi:hypothetical protein
MKRAAPFFGLFLLAVLFSGDCACSYEEQERKRDRLRTALALSHASNAILEAQQTGAWKDDESARAMIMLSFVLSDRARELAELPPDTLQAGER